MSVIDRRFRLADEAGGLGLSCDSAGVSLAGAPLLRSTAKGLEPRPASEIDALVKAAYGRDVDAAGLMAGLDVVARTLNQGDLGRAMIAAVRLKLPDLNWEAAKRLAGADQGLAKYNDQEPRDWHGRWTAGAGAGPTGAARPPRKPMAGRANHPSPKPAQPNSPPKASNNLSEAARALLSLQPILESKFDDLGPVEFSKRVTKFGEWLGSQGAKLNPAARLNAQAEYAFLQSRLSFWLNYDYTPQLARGNLISAALTLYTGAVNGGIVRVGGRNGGLPRSMLAVATAGMAYEGANPSTGMQRLVTGRPSYEYTPIDPARSWRLGLGGVVSNDHVRIVWGRGIADQGEPWEKYIKTQLAAPGERTLPGAKTWDFIDRETGYVISAKTLDTTTFTYASKPQKVYAKLSGYIDSTANYKLNGNGRQIDIKPAEFTDKQVQVAVPSDTNPAQWFQIRRAIAYGRTRGISVVVTRIG